MADPTRIPERQLDLGAASYFKVVTEATPGNQAKVRPGFLYAGGHSIIDRLTAGDQTTAAFAPVLAAQQRYDLIYLSILGAATILQGNAVAFGSPVFDGAPGFNLGPPMPDQALPLAYVFVDETGAVVVDTADIIPIGGQFQVTRDLDGHLVDKGSLGAPPAGLSDVVTTLFAAELPGGGTAVAGVVTAAPLNYTRLLDQAGDEILHNTGARMYGRLTEAAGVWTLAYHYVDAAGAEQTMDPSADTDGPAPTDLRLVGVPKVFSRNDPNRPLFPSDVSRLSDQIAGDIPLATLTVPGKVLSAAGAPATPVAGVFNAAQNAGVPVPGGNAPYHTINALGGGLVSPGPGILNFPGAASPGQVVQQVRTLITTSIAVNVVTPLDNTIPQNTEGVLVAQVTITPSAVGNILEFEFIGWGRQAIIETVVFHIHVSGTANAFAAADHFSGSAAAGSAGGVWAIRGYIVGGLPLVSTTYDLRIGATAATGNLNAALYGAARISTFTVTEYLP